MLVKQGQYPRLICWDRAACEQAVRFLSTCFLIANDIETFPFKKKNKSKVFTLTVNAYTGIDSEGRIRSFAFPFQKTKHPASGAPDNIEHIYRTCLRINSLGIPFTYHNGAYDCAWLVRYGLPPSNYAYDSMTMWWSFYPELPKSLDFVSSILLDDYQYWKSGRKENDFEQYMYYAMQDTESTLRNTLILIEQLTENKAARINFFYAHLRVLSGLSMSLQGLGADMNRMEEFKQILTEKAGEALARLRFLIADPDFNVNSPKQRHELIYKLLGARPRNAKGKFIAKVEDASTGAMALRALRSDHPIFRIIVNAILAAAEPAKQLSNVVGLAMLDPPEGSNVRPRFLTSYAGTGTTTTRYSSSASSYGYGGNAQNIRKDYRNFGVADNDCFLLEVDYSAADDCFVAYESEEQKKIEVIESGADVHAYNASSVFFPNWSYDAIVDGKKNKDDKIVHPITGIRQITKKLVHGCHYLMAGSTLLMSAQREAIVAAAKELGHADAGTWTQDRLVKYCEKLEGAFRAFYPRFHRTGNSSWYMDLQRIVASEGGFTTVFNYFQRFLDSPKEDSVLRAIAATAGQANTAGRVNMAMDELVHGVRLKRFRDGPAPDMDDITRSLRRTSNTACIRLQTHDSIAFHINFRDRRWQETVSDIFTVMRRPVICKGREFRVGIEADVSWRWAGKESRTVDSVTGIEKFLAEVERK